MVHVNACRDQQAHGFDMPTLARRDQGRAAIAVGAFKIGTMGQGKLKDFITPACTRQQIGAVLNQIFLVNVGTGFDQCLGNVYLVRTGCKQERTAAIDRTFVEFRSFSDQLLHPGQFTVPHGGEQCLVICHHHSSHQQCDRQQAVFKHPGTHVTPSSPSHEEPVWSARQVFGN